MVKQYRVAIDGVFHHELDEATIDTHKTGLLTSALAKDPVTAPIIKLGVSAIELDVCNHHPKFTVYCGYGRRITINLAARSIRIHGLYRQSVVPASSDVWRCARIHWESFKDQFPRIRHFDAARLWQLQGREVGEGVVDYGFTEELQD